MYIKWFIPYGCGTYNALHNLLTHISEVSCRFRPSSHEFALHSQNSTSANGLANERPDSKDVAKEASQPLANGTMAAEGMTPLFSKSTRAIVWGMQSRAVQGMLDFDYSCSRSTPSVVAMVYPLVWEFLSLPLID